MPSLVWHNYLIFLSFIACVAGLSLLSACRQPPVNEHAATEQMLLKMTFAYWMVYCITFGIQKINLPDWDVLLLSLKLTAVISYLLTFSCVLTLPLHLMSATSQQAE